MPTVTKTSKRRPWQAPKRPDGQWGHTRPNRELYNSARWRVDSKAHKAENPLCVMCLEKGLAVDSYVSDHIIPVNNGGSVWDWGNRQALCRIHHDKKSREESKLAKSLRNG